MEPEKLREGKTQPSLLAEEVQHGVCQPGGPWNSSCLQVPALCEFLS
ncbi:rCG60663 [Rattus norvegicus]|uniref:RCG60663 n=1 Tax=Rattus norvegicus TaxID=10116 RepID=A6JKX2_RAT|nr:rCG60663 [Rattus norvegicus]